MERGLIVSCQALPEEPLHSPFIMGRMAKAAKQSGAIGIRANSVADITEIKQQVELPIIGIIKQNYPGMAAYITPTYKEVEQLMDIGVDIVALDATINQDEIFLESLKHKYPNQKFMADISTTEEGLRAGKIGFDYIGTTLVGYTEHSKGIDKYQVLEALIAEGKSLIIAEGNYNTPQEAARAMKMGVHAVVVGSAITRPQVITRWFVEAISTVL